MKKNVEALSKDQILSATEETIRRFGVDKTSVTDVAKTLNVSHGTIYRYFKSKAELLEGTTERWLNETIIVPLTVVYEDRSLKGTDALKTYIQTLSELKRSYAHQERELFAVYTKVTEEAADLVEQHIHCMMKQMSKMIERSDLKVHDANRLAQSIFFATIRFHHPSHSHEWDSPTIHQEFQDLWNLLAQGLLSKN